MSCNFLNQNEFRFALGNAIGGCDYDTNLLSCLKERVVDVFKNAGREIQLVEEISSKYLNYNCFSHALGFPRDEPIRVRDSKVMKQIIESKALVLEEEGSIAIYSNLYGPQHAGIRCGNKILSKWGPGHIWLHNIWDVQNSYGDKLEYYSLINYDLAHKVSKDSFLNEDRVPELSQDILTFIKSGI